MSTTGYKLVKSIGNYSLLADCCYQLQYLPGTTVKARQDTLGIMLFDTIESVRWFVDTKLQDCDINWEYVSLLEVEYDTSRQFSDIQYVCRFVICSHMHDFYTGCIDNNYKVCRPPLGTVCCPEVYVVREILTGYKS